MTGSPSGRRVPFPSPWRRSLTALLLVSCFSFGLAACASDSGGRQLGCASSSVPCLSGTAVVSLETSKGPVEFTLDGDAAPLTAGNFVDLVKRGVYDGTVFHRVVREPVPFVVQGGDPLSKDAKVPVSQYGTGSFIDPATNEARLIPLEIAVEEEKEPRYGEPITSPSVTRRLRLRHAQEPHQQGNHTNRRTKFHEPSKVH
jgi:peptidyl-prolyl cis-trans isomerase B (cyclophilin B)